MDITNTSDRDGQEIVQVYYRDLVAQVTRPVKELCAFKKIHLNAKSTQTVTFTIDAQRFGYFTANFRFIVDPGAFALWVGPSSEDGLTTEFTIR